jgi:CMP-N-acetylneuraminic acid synthetase
MRVGRPDELMEVIGLIPARGGSKAIPRKNLVHLAGKPLLAYTVEVALGSDVLTRTVVSTDSDEIAEAAEKLGAEVLRRPPELGRDESPMRAVIEHALRELGDCDALVLLQPTSPLRRAEHVDEAVRLLFETGADSVVSVVEVPHRFRPSSLMAFEQDRLVALGPSDVRRQDKPNLYARNGPAVLVLRPDRIGSDLYDGDCRPYVMRPEDSVDVDEPFDLELVEVLLRRRSG